MYDLFQYLHVIAMFGAVAASVFPELLAHLLVTRRSLAGLQAVMPVFRPLGMVIPGLFLLGVAFGLITAAVGGLDFFQPWLIASYVVFAAVFLVSGVIGGGWLSRLGQDVMSPDEAQARAAIESAARDRRGVFAAWFGDLGILVIVFFMVVKPGG
jgi:hypothetical protein